MSSTSRPNHCLMCGATVPDGDDTCPACGEARAAGLWREGQLLVMHRESRLPNICFLSGEPTERRQGMTLRWRNGVLLYFLVFLATIPPFMFAVLPLLLLAIWLGFVRRVVLDIPLTEESSRELKRRRKFWLVPPALVVTAFAMAPFLEPLLEPLMLWADRFSQLLFLIVWTALLLMFGTVALLLYPLSVVAFTRLIQNNFGILLSHMKGDYIWLRGGHPSLLDRLPKWPGDQVTRQSPPPEP